MKKLWAVIAVVVLTTGALVWWLSGDPEVTTEAAPPSPGEQRSSLDTPFVRTDDGEDDAGVGRVAGLVVDGDDKPVAGARVRLFAHAPELDELECGLCHALVLECEEASTVKRVITMLREGKLPAAPPIAEALTDAEGRFSFESAPLDGELVATSGSSSAVALSEAENQELVLEPPLTESVHVVDSDGTPLPNAIVTLYSPREGTLTEKRPDAEGMVTFTTLDHGAWVFAEAEGTLPAGHLLSFGGELMLAPPRTLIVRTQLGGKPVDADVELFLHGEPQTFRSKDGVLKLEQLPFGYYAVKVSSPEFAAPEQSAELVQPVTELVFELRRGAKLLVTVVTSSGEPLDSVSGSLSGNDSNASAEAEQGALLVLGPVPEGEYSLSLSSEGMVTVERPIDLKPGETTLEVVMRAAPRLKGLVLGADGKPVAMARISAWEGEQEIALDLTDDDGKFDLELHYGGTFVIKAEEQRAGVAELTTQVPGSEVTLRLATRGVLEVEVIDADGKPLPNDVLVRSLKDQSVKWLEDLDGPVGRLAGLTPGSYVVEKTIPERLPISQQVEISDGKVTRVTLKADKGATITGKVVDHQGKPVEQAIVMVEGRAETTMSDAEGRFAWKGVKPGATELWAIHPNSAESPRVKATAPAADVTLVVPEVAHVTGRVVDERGAPVTSFEANSENVKSEDGRFDVAAPNHTLDIWVEGYTSVFLTPAEGDVGDVVLKKEPVIEGDVVDQEGKPVSGATVMGSIDLTPSTTDASGRFRVVLTTDEPQDVVATRGAMSGRAPARPGSAAHLVMQQGTSLSGKVVDANGKPVLTQVTATSRTVPRPMELDTDENGRFQMDLPQGVWLFSTRSNRVQRAIDVRGARMDITLGEEPGACGLTVRSTRPIDALWLLSVPMGDTDGPWDLVGTSAGSVEVPVNVPSVEVSARGLPCGSYTLAASIENVVATRPLELRSAGQQVQIEPRPVEPEPTEETAAVP